MDRDTKKMIKTAYRELTERREWLLTGLLLLLGCALRLAALDALPYGLNQDEASAGYEAYALLTAGMDRNGDPWPVLFTSWGSGQNVLMSYLAIPFVALLGLSERTLRLVNALSACLTLVVFWLLARRCRGKCFGLLALNPRHIMMGRWALESNLLPFFLLTGIWLTSLAEEKPWTLVGAAAAFGLSLYAYGTAFFFLPPFLLGAVIWLRRSLRPAPFLLALALGALLAAPIAACQAVNALGLDEVHILGLTLPKLTEGRQAATSVFGGASAAENFRGFLRILWTQSDGLIWNSLGLWKGGIFYFFGLPTAALGFAASVLTRRDRTEEAPVRLALVCALLCAALIRCNLNRVNMIWLPLIYFSAVGVHLVLSKLGGWAALPAAGMLACFVVFVSAYSHTFGGAGNVNFYPGLGEAIRYAETQRAGVEPICITNYVNQPYSFALFYTRPAPDAFAESVEYLDGRAAFRQVLRFEGFEFREPERCGVLILRRGEAGGYRSLEEFGDFVVCARGGT